MSWLSARLKSFRDSPTEDFRRMFSRQWEYEQADTSIAWDSERDIEALRAALAPDQEVPEEAFDRLLGLAAAGSAVATTAVGEGYYWGTGTPVDPLEAENWLRKSYELGSRRGLLSYGRVVYRRDDWPLAEQIFRSGAARGWPEAMARLADVLARLQPGGKMTNEVRSLLQAAAAAGHPWARLRLGRAMLRGQLGPAHLASGLQLLWKHVTELRGAWEAREPPNPQS